METPLNLNSVSSHNIIVIKAQETIATTSNNFNDKMNDILSVESQRIIKQNPEQFISTIKEIHTEKKDISHAIGPMNTKLRVIKMREGDKGAMDEEINSVNSIQIKLNEDNKCYTQRNTLKIDVEEVKENVLKEFGEERTSTYRSKPKTIKFSEDLSSIISQSRDKGNFSFDDVF